MKVSTFGWMMTVISLLLGLVSAGPAMVLWALNGLAWMVVTTSQTGRVKP